MITRSSLLLTLLALLLIRPAEAQGLRMEEGDDTLRVRAANFARFDSLAHEAAERQAADAAQVRRLVARLAELEAYDSEQSVQARQVETLATRLTTLEKLNENRYRSEIALEQLRFRTGKEVLAQTIRDSDKLKFALDLVTIQDEFAALTNPINNEVFKRRFEQIQGEMRKQPTVLASNPLLANPFISLAVSVGSLFASRLDQDDKEAALEDLTCVVSFSTRTQSELQALNMQLSVTNQRVEAFNRGAKEFFDRYVQEVAYGKGWDGYVQEVRHAVVADPVDEAARAFFEPLEADTVSVQQAAGMTPPELVPVKYNIEQLKTYIKEYEDILKEMDAYLQAYQRMLKSYEGYSCQGLPDLKARLETIGSQLSSAREQFQTAYTNVPPRSVRILYGIYTGTP